MTVLVAEEQLSTEGENGALDVAPAEPTRTDRSFAFPGHPAGLAVASDGTLFVSATTSGTIWRIDGGSEQAVAVPWAGGVSDAASAGRRVLSPAGLATGPDGTLIVADATGHRVWVVSPDRAPRLLAGSVSGYRDGPGDEALFRRPSDLAIGPGGGWWSTPTSHCQAIPRSS